MKWSWKIGRIAGVDVFFHWTFLLLVGWILASYLATGQGWIAALSGLAFVIALFACVVAHELGHALAARRFGVSTQDITLYPIGGVAQLQRIPEHPYQEFFISIAGPLVNVVIAAAIAFGMALTSGISTITGVSMASGFMTNLLWANVALVVFNLIPAFPMDGGRILRAGLASFMEYSKATRIAAGVGQVLAILLAIAGLFVLNNPFLLFIALFIYLGASSESQMSEVRAMLRGVPVREAMMTRFQSLHPNDSLHDAARELLAGTQQDFPVVEGGQLVGMLRRSDLAKGLAAGSMDVTVGEAMTRDFPTATSGDLLDVAMVQMKGNYSMPVLSKEQQLIGLVDTENIGELMMVRTAMVGVVARSTHPLEQEARSENDRESVLSA